jgi:hypothetical protein
MVKGITDLKFQTYNIQYDKVFNKMLSIMTKSPMQ